jgi:septal ring factor EnvC (AmiA/AmiB activator)
MKTFAATLVLALAPFGAAAQETPAPRASPAGDRLKKVQERRKSLEQELSQMRRQEKSLLGEVERLEVEVRLRGEQLREVQLDLQRTNELLDATLKRLRQIEKQVEESRPVLAARARALYKLGDLSYLRLLLSVDRPSDIFRGYRLVTQLARRDNERFSAFRADLRAQAETREELEKRTQQALLLRAASTRTAAGRPSCSRRWSRRRRPTSSTWRSCRRPRAGSARCSKASRRPRCRCRWRSSEARCHGRWPAR